MDLLAVACAVAKACDAAAERSYPQTQLQPLAACHTAVPGLGYVGSTEVCGVTMRQRLLLGALPMELCEACVGFEFNWRDDWPSNRWM